MMLERFAQAISAWLHGPRPAPAPNQMREDWDGRARENALYYIVTNAAESEEQFAASGEQSVRDILADVDQLVPRRGTVLEIGCGIGRMLRPLARSFSMVHGVDVSAEMIGRARQRLADLPNVRVHLTDGDSVGPVRSGTVDLAISYLVFQHIPELSAVEGNVRDVFRVLAPGGLFKFQVAGRLDTEEANAAEQSRPKTTWNGVTFTDREIRDMVERIGFTVRTTYSHHPPDSCIFLWVIAEKPGRRAGPRVA